MTTQQTRTIAAVTVTIVGIGSQQGLTINDTQIWTYNYPVNSDSANLSPPQYLKEVLSIYIKQVTTGQLVVEGWTQSVRKIKI